MNMFNGMRVIESIYLEEDGEPMLVRRTWRERLLSWPWRPWVTSRIVILKVPYRGVVQLNSTTLVMHPATVRQLRSAIADRKEPS